jgi:hypothetical protein
MSRPIFVEFPLWDGKPALVNVSNITYLFGVYDDVKNEKMTEIYFSCTDGEEQSTLRVSLEYILASHRIQEALQP